MAYSRGVSSVNGKGMDDMDCLVKTATFALYSDENNRNGLLLAGND